jgi:hypothetical protein
MLITVLVAALGTAHVPARPVALRVWSRGAELRRVADPASDTCNRQFAYVDKRGRTIAEFVGCFGGELDNWTHNRIRVTYRKATR